MTLRFFFADGSSSDWNDILFSLPWVLTLGNEKRYNGKPDTAPKNKFRKSFYDFYHSCFG